MPTATLIPANEQDSQVVGPAKVDRGSTLNLLTLAAILIASCVVCFGFLRFGKDVFGVGYEDDFYYYALVAHNLAFHGRSTFDGIHLTNGYHPLWLLILSLADAIFDPDGPFHPGSMVPFAAALSTLQVMLVLAMTFFAGRILRMRCGRYTSASVQLLLATSALVFARSGMEACLTTTIAFALLLFRLRPTFQWSRAAAISYGLLCSTLILSRLDSILLVSLLFIFDVLAQSPRSSQRANSASFLLGLFPVVAYLALNHWIFGMATPVSGTAKQLRFHHVPSLSSLNSFAENILNMRSPMNRFWVPLTILALCVLWMRPRTAGSQTRGVLRAILLFPLLHMLVISTLSDWPIWGWYLYGWVVSGVVAVTVLIPERPRTDSSTGGALGALPYGVAMICLALFTYMIVTFTREYSNPIYTAALDVEGFAKTHPGIYAMGDRAGAVAWLTRQPVIQLEGLTMDRAYLENIRQQRDLVSVMRQYGVRYYISTRAKLDRNGCYLVREPWQAGPDSPVMYGRLCAKPLLEIDQQGFINDVFDLRTLQP